MTLRRRILLYYSVTLAIALLVVGYWSWYEFVEQRDIALQGGAAAVRMESPLVETAEVLLWGGLPAIALGILGGCVFIGRALRPIGDLTQELEKTNASNLSDPVKRSGNGDELDRMAHVFNGMKQRLAVTFTQTRDFTLNASHELKTPLTIMHSTLEEMLGAAETPESHRERVTSMLEEVQRLSTIVGQLSFLARADAGLMPLARDSVALHEMVTDVAEEAGILGMGAEINVELTECENLKVVGDKMRLRQLLLNLVDNAVKYNEKGGSIEISLRQDGGRAKFVITNTGHSLSPDLCVRVFERFFRGDPSHSSSIEGSGLGLCIAKSIAEAHGGRVKYEVLSDGRTRVTVELLLEAHTA